MWERGCKDYSQENTKNKNKNNKNENIEKKSEKIEKSDNNRYNTNDRNKNRYNRNDRNKNNRYNKYNENKNNDKMSNEDTIKQLIKEGFLPSSKKETVEKEDEPQSSYLEHCKQKEKNDDEIKEKILKKGWVSFKYEKGKVLCSRDGINYDNIDDSYTKKEKIEKDKQDEYDEQDEYFKLFKI